MDAPEVDQDVALQRVSADLVADFTRSLPVYLRSGADHVRVAETVRLTSTLLDPFLELPQLLDPHLASWISLLSDSYLSAVSRQRHSLLHPNASPTAVRTPPQHCRSHVEPLTTGIAKLLYSLCKIRGAKVVVRFLAGEARYLELLLSALEAGHESLAWEERYMVLLWLSHLALAPFDLASMSSLDLDDDDDLTMRKIPHFRWPEEDDDGGKSGNVIRGGGGKQKTPTITLRIVPLAVRYLASPGRERDAACALLVRMAVRRDMQELGLLDRLVQWALASLSLSESSSDVDLTAYSYIGVLSFLAGVCESAPDASAIAHAVQSLPPAVVATALARKKVIKVVRSVAGVLLMRRGSASDQDLDPAVADTVEAVIGHLFEAVADPDTSVRFASSKALGVVTLRLPPSMAVQVVDAALAAFARDDELSLAAADPLEWHGLTLTLAHLLYRRSPPAETLPEIIRALRLGLSFERRNATGGSVGTNVRDAACFGIWALARRYTTVELLAVSPQDSGLGSALQTLATELVVAACLDSAGNIRRGASAALQELVGRHPGTVEQAIQLVQAVDYHAVALRARAVYAVALAAAHLGSVYGDALLGGLLGWRGVGDPDANLRRTIGTAYGAIVAGMASEPGDGQGNDPIGRYGQAISGLKAAMIALQPRQVDELHGLLHMLASTVDQLAATDAQQSESLSTTIIAQVSDTLQYCQSASTRKPEIIAEAASRLLVSSLPLLRRASTSSPSSPASPSPSSPSPDKISLIKSTLEALLPTWLLYQDKAIISAVSEASRALILLSSPADRRRILESWSSTILRPRAGYAVENQDSGYFFALVSGLSAEPSTSTSTSQHHAAPDPDRELVINVLRTRWSQDPSISTRVAILQALAPCPVLATFPLSFLDIIQDGLRDYTITARGDVGSHVRLEALCVTRSLWSRTDDDDDPLASKDLACLAPSALFQDVIRLAAEKLDRVRTEAQTTLALALRPSARQPFLFLSNSSPRYFSLLLSLTHRPDSPSSPSLLRPSLSAPSAAASTSSPTEALLSGLVISAESGSEDLVMATRHALCQHARLSPTHLAALCAALVSLIRARLPSATQPRDAERVLMPALQILAFLIRADLFTSWDGVDPFPSMSSSPVPVTLKTVCLLAQKAGYKSGSIRKIEACIKVYGAVASSSSSSSSTGASEGVVEAGRRLGALLYHPWPKVRSLVVDELWGVLAVRALMGPSGGDGGVGAKTGLLKAVDWAKASKQTIRTTVEELGLV